MPEPRQAASQPGPEDTQEFEAVEPLPRDSGDLHGGRIVGQVELDELDWLVDSSDDVTRPSLDDTQEIFPVDPESD